MVEPVRLHHPTRADAVAVVSVEPATAPGMAMVRVARGGVGGGTTYGPYPEDGVAEAFALAIQALEGEGYAVVTPGWDLLEALTSESATKRARAAVRIGWRRKTDAIPALRTAAKSAMDQKRAEVGVMVEALALLGDADAAPLARALANRKHLARRRSGVEALRLLGDHEALAEARARAETRLPPDLLAGLASDASVEALVELATADAKRAGMHADVLYEIGTPRSVAVARRVLARIDMTRPNLWKYAKSTFKRALFRRDAKTFGFFAHAIDTSRGPGVVSTVKSGLDGKKRPVRVHGPKTQAYLRRACARHLRDLSRWEPATYAQHAAETLVHYRPSDARNPKGRHGAFAHCLVMGTILRANDPRVELVWGRWRATGHSLTAKRPEAHPALWDAAPSAVRRVLSGARLASVFEFGMRALERDRTILDAAPFEELRSLLNVDPAMAGGTPFFHWLREAIDNRVRQEAPFAPHALSDDSFTARMLPALTARALPPVMEEGTIEWLTMSASSWTRTESLVFQLPAAVTGRVRQAVVDALVGELKSDATLRAEYAPGFLAVLQADEPQPGAHSGYASVAREALLDELGDVLDLKALLGWLDNGGPSGRSVAGALIGARGDGLEALGRDRVVSMCEDEIRAVRASAQAVVVAARETLRANPSLLFALAESRWDDTRDVAFDMLREFGPQVLGLDGMIGLCDSNDADVERLGRELIARQFAALDAETVLFRLSEHPRQSMQRFALGLIDAHLRPGLIPLSRLAHYWRAVLFDTWPSRPLKYGVLEFLARRGAADERQAEYVVEVLTTVLRTHTRGDFERIAQILTQLGVAFPEVANPLPERRAQAEGAP